MKLKGEKKFRNSFSSILKVGPVSFFLSLKVFFFSFKGCISFLSLFLRCYLHYSVLFHVISIARRRVSF